MLGNVQEQSSTPPSAKYAASSVRCPVWEENPAFEVKTAYSDKAMNRRSWYK